MTKVYDDRCMDSEVRSPFFYSPHHSIQSRITHHEVAPCSTFPQSCMFMLSLSIPFPPRDHMRMAIHPRESDMNVVSRTTPWVDGSTFVSCFQSSALGR
jgi:hypothetical protein